MLQSFESSAAGSSSPPPVDVNAICRHHWPVLHAAAMRRGCDVHVAEDAVQDLFCGLIRRGQLHHLGSLPAAHQTARLTTKLRHEMANRWRDARRIKRGGGQVFIPLWNNDGTPLEITDEQLSPDPTEATARRRVLRRAILALRAELKPATWNFIAPWLLGLERGKMSGALRVALHRARARLRELISESL